MRKNLQRNILGSRDGRAGPMAAMGLMLGTALAWSMPLPAAAADRHTRGKEIHDCGYGWERLLAIRVDQFQIDEPLRSPSFYARNIRVQLPAGSAPPGHQEVRNHDLALQLGQLGFRFWAVESATARSLEEKARGQIPKDIATIGVPVWWDKRPGGAGPIHIMGHIYQLMFTPDREWQEALRTQGIMWADLVSGNNNFKTFAEEQQPPLRWQQRLFYRIPGLPDDYKVFRSRPKTTAVVGMPDKPPPQVRDPDLVDDATAKAEALRMLAEYMGSLLHRQAANALEERANKKVALAIADIARNYPIGETVWVEVTWGGYEVTVKNADALSGLLEAGKDAEHCVKFEDGAATKFRIGYEREDGWVRDTGEQRCAAGSRLMVEDSTRPQDRRVRLDVEHKPRHRPGLDPNETEGWVYEVERICVEGTAPKPEQLKLAAILVDSVGPHPWTREKLAEFPGVAHEVAWYEGRGYQTYVAAATEENIVLALDYDAATALSYFGPGSPNAAQIAGQSATDWKNKMSAHLSKVFIDYHVHPYVAVRWADKLSTDFGFTMMRNHSCGSLDPELARQFVKPGGRYDGVKRSDTPCPPFELVTTGKVEPVLTEIRVPDRNVNIPGHVGFWGMQCERGGAKLQYGGPLTLMLEGKKVAFALELDPTFGNNATMASTPGVQLISGVQGFFQGELGSSQDGTGNRVNPTERKFSFEDKSSGEARTITIVPRLVAKTFFTDGGTKILSSAGFLGAGSDDTDVDFKCSGSWATGPEGLRRRN